MIFSIVLEAWGASAHAETIGNVCSFAHARYGAVRKKNTNFVTPAFFLISFRAGGVESPRGGAIKVFSTTVLGLVS